MGMTFHANEAILMRLTVGVMVRTRSIQWREREVTMEMLNKLVDVPWDPTGVVRDQLDGGHHDGEHVIPGQMFNEDGLPVTRDNITSHLIWQCGPELAAQNVAQLFKKKQTDSAALTRLQGTYRRTCPK